MKTLAQWALALSLSCLACSGIRVTTDIDPNADLTRVRSYAWLDERSGVEGERTEVTSLIDRRVRHAVDEELQRKGISSAAKNTADVLVSYHLGVATKLDVNTIDQGYGRGLYTGGVSHTTVTEYQEGTLLIDFIEPKANQLVWRGSGQARIWKSTTPEQREKRIAEAVAQILESFPPSAKR
jgi:Domain of unknown function (DUF4136)